MIKYRREETKNLQLQFDTKKFLSPIIKLGNEKNLKNEDYIDIKCSKDCF